MSQAPVSAPARAPLVVNPGFGTSADTINIIFKVGQRPSGTPGKEDFNMRTVLDLHGPIYMVFLNGIRDIANKYGFNPHIHWNKQNRSLISKIFDKAAEIFPGLYAFHQCNNPQWPVEAALQVVAKSARDTKSYRKKALSQSKIVPPSPNTLAERKKKRQESAKRAAATRKANRIAAEDSAAAATRAASAGINEISEGVGMVSIRYDDNDNDKDEEMDSDGPDELSRELARNRPASNPLPPQAESNSTSDGPVLNPPPPGPTNSESAAVTEPVAPPKRRRPAQRLPSPVEATSGPAP
ncbi:hypothetical protein FRC09_016321, partial [Ceratobasidium sp. 395]